MAEYYLPRLGGVEHLIDDLAHMLADRRHEVRILTMTPEGTSEQGARVPSVPTLQAENFQAVRIPSLRVPMMGVPISPLLPKRLREDLIEWSPDVVHVHASIASAGALAGGWAAHSLGLPLVVTVHSTLGGHEWVYRLSNALTRWGSWPQVVAGVSPTVADGVSKVLGRPTSVLANGVDIGWWSEGCSVSVPARNRIDLVTVQRLKNRKRGSVLLEVVAAAQKNIPDGHTFRVTFVGDGPRRSSLERKASRLGVEARFLGAIPRKDVREVLGNSDVFILPSTRESFGISALEARAVGLPVVAFRTGSLPEIVPDGLAGLLVNSDQGMVDALTQLACDRGLLMRLCEGSMRNPPPFDWPLVVEEHERIYREASGCRG